ncbi:MAG: hypothetical protein IID05_01555 [Gemmatimonadetes bacterium]|nr:hypothetical protein [Gemmatimonadota bacterium]
MFTRVFRVIRGFLIAAGPTAAGAEGECRSRQLAGRWLGPSGVFLAMTLAFSSLAVVSAAVFRRGKWKKKVV